MYIISVVLSSMMRSYHTIINSSRTLAMLIHEKLIHKLISLFEVKMKNKMSTWSHRTYFKCSKTLLSLF